MSTAADAASQNLISRQVQKAPPLPQRFCLAKYHGAENDFLFAAMDPAQYAQSKSDMPQFARTICARNTGMGADGLVIWGGNEDNGFRVSIWNADGSFASTCGNALRCMGLLLVRRGLWNGEHPIHIRRFLEDGNETFATLVSCQPHPADTHNAIVTVVMGSLQSARPLPLAQLRELLCKCSEGQTTNATGAAKFFGSLAAAWFVELANPHVVLSFEHSNSLSSLKQLAENFGEAIKRALLDSGLVEMEVNLGLLCPQDQAAEEPRQNLLVVHERGAGVTRACGSGAVAATYAVELGQTEASQPQGKHEKHRAPFHRQFQMPGGNLSITLRQDPGSFQTVAYMEGPCTFLFEATLNDHHAGLRLPRSSSSW